MIMSCPKCQTRHDVSGRKPGETFNCTCGNVLAAPKKGGMSWLIILAIIAACSVPCIGILAAIAIPNFMKYQSRAKTSEARVNLRAIATAERSYYAEKDAFVAAGPVPAQIPGKMPMAFVPDTGFEALMWSPAGNVRFQYQVKVTGPKTIEVIARGDLDGNGRASEYKMAVTSDGPMGEVQEKDPLE